MSHTETFQKVVELYEAFRKQNGITGYYNTEPCTEGWMMSERMVAMTSKGNCEKVDCTELVHNLNNIPGVKAEEAYAYDSTYGFAFTIA